MESGKVFKKLSKNAKVSLRLAGFISKDLFALNVEPVHLFIAVMLNSKSLGARALISIGVETEKVLSLLVGSKRFDLSQYDLSQESELVYSDKSKEILRGAFALANRYSHVYVGTEHILLSILNQKDLTFLKDMAQLGFDLNSVKQSVVSFATYPIGILAKPESEEVGDDSPSMLNVFGKDLVALAKEGKLDPLVGREHELSQIINVLSRRRKNNPIIVGDPGVGKTAIIEGLAQLISAGTVPNSLLNSKIISLDVSAIVAGSKLRGDMEEKMIAIIKQVTETPNTILFIDEIHNIMSTNAGGGGMDIASILKPALVRDDFRVIGATTYVEFARYFEEDNALVRRFQPIYVDEPSIDETVQILKRVEPLLEKHHQVNILDDAIYAAAKLSDRYVSDRFLPDKAIDLLDEAAASRRLELEVKYKEVADLITERQRASVKKEEAVASDKMDEATKWRDEEGRLDLLLDEIEKKRVRSKNAPKFKVGVDTVQKVVSKWTGIPISTIDAQEADILKNLQDHIAEGVVGQTEAVQSVARAIKRARTGIAAPDRPWASLLFLGPTGVGKTELAKVLTKLLFGDEDRLIQIDMSELMEMHSVSKLIGSPPGYVGYREGGQLTEKIRQKPHSVILFDEIEKAHPDVLNILLQILEYGHLTDGKGRKVNFKNTVVVLTSNIGAEEIQKDKILGFGSEAESSERDDEQIERAYDSMRDELMSELKDTLRPELLNRLDDIVIFRSLTRKDAKQIVEILVRELNARLGEQNLNVEISNRVKEYIVKEGFSEQYGARNLRRVIQDKAESILADYILDNPTEGLTKQLKLAIDLNSKGEFTVKKR